MARDIIPEVTMSSVHGKLKGKKWSVWTEEIGPSSPPGDIGRGHSPIPTGYSEDVRKLPKEEMHTYGLCPSWDRFVVVTCEKCKRVVKLEALESHITLRHGSKSERNAYQKIIAARSNSAFRTCQVKLAPMARLTDVEDTKICDTQPESLISGSSGSTSPTPSHSHPSTPPQFQGSSPSPFPTPTPPLSSQVSVQRADSYSAPDTRSPTPDDEISRPDDHGDLVEDMDIDFIDQIPGTDEEILSIKDKPEIQNDGPVPLVSAPVNETQVENLEYTEEADSTTNNVISIPDTDDISNIEIDIISEGQVFDSISTKYNVSLMKPELSMNAKPFTKLESPSTPTRPVSASVASSVSVTSLTPSRTTFQLTTTNTLLTPTKPVSLPPRPNIFLSQSSQLSSPKFETESSTPTHYINVSPFSKVSPKKPVLLKAALDKKPTGREREYDPNKHCGVWDDDAKRHCTRSLTCKSHSVYLKRKVINRAGPFDQLLAAHKAEKEALLKVPESTDKTDAGSILARRLQPSITTPIQKIWDSKDALKHNSLLKPSVVKQVVVNQNYNVKDNYCDENLDYTLDHPKPMAVCTYGGKRIGGIFITDRSKFLTRKVMKIAISSAGLQRIQPSLQTNTGIQGVKRLSGLVSVPVTSRQQSLPYLLNVQGGGAPQSSIQRVGMNGSPRIGTLQLAGSQHYVVQDAFKTDIQDFKGGIKFELGRNIHHVIPQDPGVSTG